MDKLLDFSEYKHLTKRTSDVINWWQLFPNHSASLMLEYQKQIFEEAIQKAGNYTNLSAILDMPRKAISACYRLRQKPTIQYLVKIFKYTKKPMREANDRFIEIVGLKNPKLPFILDTPEAAEVIAAFLSDGHLPKIPYKNPMYCAYEKELHVRLIEVCKKIFGEFEVDIKPGHKSLLTRFPCPIGTALELAGVPRGDKRRANPFLPKHIFEGTEDAQVAYLRRAFDDEGDVHISKTKRAIRLTRSTDVENLYDSVALEKQKWIYGIQNTPINNLILGEYLLLKKVGIDARLYREGIYRSLNGRTTVKWRIQIAQQDSLKAFAEKVGFTHSEKRKKLEQAIKSYIKRKAPNGFTEKIVWAHIINLSKQKKFITFKDIGKKLKSLNMNYDFAGAFLRKFLVIGKIKKTKRGVYNVSKHD